MTKLFYDNLIVFDEIVNHKVIEKILDSLPRESHEEFLELFHECPHDETAIFGYLKGKAGKDMKGELKEELVNISSDILHGLRPEDEVTKETQVSKK
jgi:hypothetical protein